MARGRHGNPVKPWEWLGITYCAYFKRLKNGVSNKIIEEMMEVKL